MSRVQVADDPGRQIRSVWLGPANSWRWWFDATYAEWGVGFLLAIITIIVLPLVVPLGLLAGAGAYLFARSTARRLSEEHEVTWRRWLFGTSAVFLALLSPSWRTWVLPMPFVLALLVGPILAVLVLRRYGRYIDWNRPFGWWVRLPLAVAAGPRLLDEDEIDPERLLFQIDQTDPTTAEVEW